MSNKEQLLSELGQCWRGDWSDFDGRTLRDQIDRWLVMPETNKDIKYFRDLYAMCPYGNGHWEEYCHDYGCSSNLKPEVTE